MKLIRRLPFFILLSIVLIPAAICSAQTENKAELRKQAMALVDKSRYLDALPILEKIAPLYPDDVDVWTHYGLAVLSHSSTVTAADERKALRVKGYNALEKARKLGTQNVTALNILNSISPDGEVEDNMTGDPEFEKNIREGEGFFGRAEYEKAFTAYEKAFKINPKSYEAVLFMADSLYAMKKYKESEPWFAKAAALDPNREAAYRFWGDALANQNKTAEAGDKFMEALIAEPRSILTWNTLGNWAEAQGDKAKSLLPIPPGSEPLAEMTIDEKLLKAEDGTISWKRYNETVASQLIKGKKRVLADEVAAYRKVAESAREAVKSGKLKTPDSSLVNLLKLDDAGLLEAYILVVRADENIFGEYETYRAANRDKLKKFVRDYLVGVQ